MTSMEADLTVSPKPKSLAPDNFLPSLEYLPYINHLVRFMKDLAKLLALLDFGSEVNIMTLVYVTKLGLKI